MIVVYAGEQFPCAFGKSIFLAGPTPRSLAVVSWRPEALWLLEDAGYDGAVFVPEPAEGHVWSHRVRADGVGERSPQLGRLHSFLDPARS